MIGDPIETFGQYWVWGVAVIFMAIWVIKFSREVYNIIHTYFWPKRKLSYFVMSKIGHHFRKQIVSKTEVIENGNSKKNQRKQNQEHSDGFSL